MGRDGRRARLWPKESDSSTCLGAAVTSALSLVAPQSSITNYPENLHPTVLELRTCAAVTFAQFYLDEGDTSNVQTE